MAEDVRLAEQRTEGCPKGLQHSAELRGVLLDFGRNLHHVPAGCFGCRTALSAAQTGFLHIGHSPLPDGLIGHGETADTSQAADIADLGRAVVSEVCVDRVVDEEFVGLGHDKV